MIMNRRIRQKRKAISDINLTNLIDVTMTTLVCYMLIAPLTEQGIDVALPQTSPHKIEQSHEIVTVTVAKNGNLYIGSNQIALFKLTEQLQVKFKQKPDTGVVIKADKGVDYGTVINVLDELNNAGITKVGMATAAKIETGKR